MIHYATRDIDIGEELTLNYGEENVKNFTSDHILITNQNK
jgi:SET domain-containing protein